MFIRNYMIDCYELTYKTYCRDDYDCYKIATTIMIRYMRFEIQDTYMILTRLAYMIMLMMI